MDHGKLCTVLDEGHEDRDNRSDAHLDDLSLHLSMAIVGEVIIERSAWSWPA